MYDHTIMEKKFVKGSDAATITGLSQQTLRKYADQNKIRHIKTDGGQRRYDVTSLLTNTPINGKQVCYCRVSTHGQKEDLKRQISYMTKQYPDFEIVSDVGSGINFNRPGLKKILDYAIQGTLDSLVVSYKDRLCRILI